jgi:hypothetical protein
MRLLVRWTNASTSRCVTQAPRYPLIRCAFVAQQPAQPASPTWFPSRPPPGRIDRIDVVYAPQRGGFLRRPPSSPTARRLDVFAT